MFSNHFVDTSFIFNREEVDYVDGSLTFLYDLYSSLGVMVSSHKTYYYLVGMTAPLDLILICWTYIFLGLLFDIWRFPLELLFFYSPYQIVVFIGCKVNLMFAIIRISSLRVS
jgi:hypothetical protein